MYRTLEYLPGISDDDVKRLRTAGIRHTNQLLHRTSLDIDRRRLSKRTGISAARLFVFANECTLLEVSGMEHALPVVRRLGIRTMGDLRHEDAKDLQRKIVDVVGMHEAPRVTDCEYWISQASALDIVEEPEPSKEPLRTID